MTNLHADQVLAAVLFVIAAYSILSQRIHDGILGKLLFSIVAVTAFAVFIQPACAYQANPIIKVSSLLLVVREILLITIFKRKS